MNRFCIQISLEYDKILAEYLNQALGHHFHQKYIFEQKKIQARAELGKAQPKLGLDRIKLNSVLAKSRKVVLD